MACPSCGAVTDRGARFCASCGASLTVVGDERRIVTVLFADLVGFTTLAEPLDPETVKNLVDRWFERLGQDITEFGGKVDKVVGDAIMALFGAPVAHEDDAERAVRAAMRMQQSLAQMAADAALGDAASGIRMRIGVNTGEVLVGSMRADGTFTAMGDVVNTASRLQSAAGPGEVLVGAATYASTRQCIRYEPRGLLIAKGREERVGTWSAVRPLLPPGSRPNRPDVPLLGRDAEMAMLHHAVDSAVANSRALLVVLVGDAGLGKTRLAAEVGSWTEANHAGLSFEGRCVPYGEANVWWPVAEALRQACFVESGTPPDAARDRTSDRVAQAFLRPVSDPEVARATNGLLHLMGYDGPLGSADQSSAREEAVRSVVAFVEASTQNQPVVVQLSDLHWADEVVLDLAETLLERLARKPFVLVATARPEIRERWHRRPGAHNVMVVNLDPLHADAAGELLDVLLGSEIEPSVREALLERAGGNPFYLEELVSLLGERGDHGVLPDTLRGLVAARLDGLSGGERMVLTDAAVLGRRGAVEHLRRMVEGMNQGVDVASAVAGLVAKEFFTLDDGRWSFRSDVVREVAYNTLTKLDRVRRHSGIAKWVEEHHAGDWSDSTVDRLAHHYGVAAELARDLGTVPDLPFDVRERALHWIGEAAERARSGEVLPVADRLHTQALDLLGDERSARRVDHLLGRSRARSDGWNLEGARSDADLALLEASECGYEPGAAQALLRLGDLAQKAGESELAVRTLDDAASRFAALGDEGGRAEALRMQGMTELFRGSFAPAKAAVGAALDAFREVGSRGGEAWALQNLAWIAFTTGRIDEAEERLQESVTTFSEIGDTVGMAWALGLLAFVKLQQGHMAEAEALGQGILVEARARGDRWATAMMLVLLASIDLWSGRTEEAVARSHEAAEVFDDVGDPHGQSQSRAVHGRALVMAGRVDEGMEAFQRGLDFGAHLPTINGIDGPAQGAMAGAAVQLGDLSRIEASGLLVDEASLDAPTLGDGDRLVGFGLARLQQGRVVEALRVLERAASRLDESGPRPYPSSALALALAADGRPYDAMRVAEQVPTHPASTYLDEATAQMAAGLALVQVGDAAAARHELERARALVDVTGDLLAQAVVRLAESVALAALGDDGADERALEADSRLVALGIDADGWRTAFALAAGVGIPATPAA